MSHFFNVIIEKDADKYLVASVPSLPGCHTQAKTFDELMNRIQEAIELCLEMENETVISVSSGETIGRGLFSQILRDCELSVNQFLKLLSRNHNEVN